MIYAREKHKVRVVTNARYFCKPVSQTFHGRDIFAPVAAYLAKGVTPARMGKLIQDYLRPAFGTPERTGKHFWTGTVLKIDHFGNVVTNFRSSDFRGTTFELVLGPHIVTKLAGNYFGCAPGELFSIEGSSGYLEIATCQGSAAKILGCAAGAPVELRTS
jgi:S-adenosylmethionine hydrolase